MNNTKNNSPTLRLPRRITGFFRHILKIMRRSVRQALTALGSSRPAKRLLSPGTQEAAIGVLRCVGLCAAGFMFGRCDLGFSVYPLGLALLIASGKLSFFSYMGSAVAALTYPSLGFAFFGVNTLIYIIRKLLLSDGFSESRRTRVLVGLGTGIFVSAALLLSDLGESAYGGADLFFASALYIICIPTAVYFLYPVTSSESFARAQTEVSLVFFCACLIMSANFALPFGGFFSRALACVATLFFCVFFENYNALCCCVFFGIATLDFTFSAPLCVSAFLFLRLYKNRQILVYPIFASVCSLLSLLVTDFSAHGSHVFAAIFTGTAFFMPAGLVICAKNAVGTLEAPPAREAVSEAYTRRMTGLSKAFGSVSKLCTNFSNRLRFPTADEAAVMIAVTSSRVCTSCPLYASCRRKQHWCSAALADSLISGKLTVGKLPESLKNDCRNVHRIVDSVNDEYKKLLTNRFNNNKTEILAREYASMARILKYTSRLSSEDVYYDGKLTRLAGGATGKLGLPNTGVTVYGLRKKILDISGVPVSCVSTPSEKMASFYSAECGVLFDAPEFILEENSTFTLRFVSKQTIAAEYVKASHTKNGETVCGDTVSFFESSDSYFYALIADGMGSGRDAAMTSRLTSVFVEKLLSGGAGKGVTMELLNSMLMSKSKECFSSVDLLELDLIERRASFVKAGAAPAYLLRSAKLFKVSSDTPPCGIIEGFCAENTSFEVFPGDIIIMLSDGITSSIDCGSTLCDVMNRNRNAPSEVIVQKILDMATTMAVHDDDMSCVMVKIK